MLGVVGEQTALACRSYGALDHVGGGRIVEDPLSHLLQAVGQVELATVLSKVERLLLPVFLEPKRPCNHKEALQAGEASRRR